MPHRTLKAFYGQTTGDTTTHQRTIDAHFKKLDKRRQAIIRELLQGKTYLRIAREMGVTATSVRESVARAIERIRKGIAEEPRYNHVGRKHAGQDF
jgi:DNA-directed RNA polymerase specialized sigma24 family protein